MKKLHLISVSILFAALCLAFTACNQGLTAVESTGTVRIVIDSGTSRAVNAEGMPELKGSNTEITVTGEDGTELKKATGTTTPITLTLAIGKKITVTVVVKTDAGEWRGTKEHTVTAGTNTVAVKLSKTPLNVKNILSKIVKNDLHDPEITLTLASGKKLAENVNITRSPSGNYLKQPVIVRDGSGRIYMLYDKDGSRHLTRFDAEGNPHCEIPLNTLLPAALISTMTVDAKTNTIFVFDASNDNVYALTESSLNDFTLSAPVGMSTLASAASSSIVVTAAAAYNGTLFLVTKANKLITCTVTLSGTSLSLTEKNVATLDNLRPSAVVVTTECTGLFADENNIYCLLREQKSDASQLYMIGALVRYTYSGGTLADKKVIGLHSQASMPRYHSLAFKENAFVNPVGFIGYDENYLYIADDGAEIRENSYIGFYTAGNKDRIAAFRRDNMELVFDDSDAPTWFAEYAGYQYSAKIPNVLWSTDKDTHKVTLELKTANGDKKPLPSGVDWFKTARDSAGSVYVLYHKDSKLLLERFAADGTKDTSFGTVKTPTLLNFDHAVTDIAVDFKTADVFLLKRKNNVSDPKLTVYMAKKTDEGYTEFSNAVEVSVPKDPGSPARIDSVAAFEGVLFAAMDVEESGVAKKNLYAYTMNTSSIGNFGLNPLSAGSVTELPELRAGTSKKTQCTGLFADRQGVYALLTQQSTDSGGDRYALGQLLRYSYDGSLNKDTTLPNGVGLNTAAAGTATGSAAYNAAYLSNPAGFIGYDGDKLYFADDGVNIEDINENYRLNGNKDRIMAFNRKDNTIPSISADEASWFESYPKSQYKQTDTKVLLWEKDFGSSPAYQGVRYWVNDNVSTAYPGDADALWASASPSESPTDVFCYDQDGNLYILYTDTVTNKSSVRRFILRDDGAYDKTAAEALDQNLTLPAGSNITAIAVDISDGNHYLYYATEHKVERYGWTGTFGSTAPPSPSYSITIPTGETVTALAANRDGVFVATKKQGLSTYPYTLRIRKYNKGSGTEDGHIIIVNEADSFDAHDAHKPYNTYDEIIHDLQVVNGVLYAITSHITKTMKEVSGAYTFDKFRSNGFLYKVGNTKASFSGTGEELHKNEADEAAKTGYGFYRFIAVKPKRLVIASDGAYGTHGADSSSHAEKDTNNVFEFDLDGHLQNGDNGKKAEATFSKKLTWAAGCSFGW